MLAASDPRLTAAFSQVKRILLTWRGRHYGFGCLYLSNIKGWGGTEGAGYLKKFVDKNGFLPGEQGQPDARLFHFWDTLTITSWLPPSSPGTSPRSE